MNKNIRIFSVKLLIIALLMSLCCVVYIISSGSFSTVQAATTSDYSGKRMTVDSITSYFNYSKTSNYSGLEKVKYLDTVNSTINPQWTKAPQNSSMTKKIDGIDYKVTQYRTYTYAYIVEVANDVVSYQSSAVQHIKGFDSSTVSIAKSNTTEEEYAYALGGGISFSSTHVDIDFTVQGTWGNTTINGSTQEVSWSYGKNDDTGYYRLQMLKNFYVYKLVIVKEYKINCNKSTQKNNSHDAFDGYYFEYIKDPSEKAVASIKGFDVNSLYSSTMFN